MYERCDFSSCSCAAAYSELGWMLYAVNLALLPPVPLLRWLFVYFSFFCFVYVRPLSLPFSCNAVALSLFHSYFFFLSFCCMETLCCTSVSIPQWRCSPWPCWFAFSCSICCCTAWLVSREMLSSPRQILNETGTNLETGLGLTRWLSLK